MINRRNFLGLAGTALATSAVAGPTALLDAKGEPIKPETRRKRALRVAHLTDIHVQPENPAPKGFANALHHAQNLQDKPDFILTGGDAIMDAGAHSKDRVKAQWNVWNDILKKECSLPLYHCIGNHDIWGWSSPNLVERHDKLYGKQWAIEEFGLSHRYYSFDKGGWHFIVLDSMSHRTFSYYGKLDDEQMEWLKDDLQKTPATTPVLVLSHIPILGISTFFDGNNEKKGSWHVSQSDMHIDARALKDLFFKHKNVKVCLSGHIHLQDSVEYLGVKYLCNGAVSGSWWGGNLQEFPPAYAVIDLYDDGTLESQFIAYNWK